MEPEPALGARGGRQGWCRGEVSSAGSCVASGFVLGPKPMAEKEGYDGV